MHESFPVQLYFEFLNGRSIRELSTELGIPALRIERRLRAAALYLLGASKPERPSTSGATPGVTETKKTA